MQGHIMAISTLFKHGCLCCTLSYACADFAYLTLKHSGQETIGELHRRACEIFDLNSEQVKISCPCS